MVQNGKIQEATRKPIIRNENLTDFENELYYVISSFWQTWVIEEEINIKEFVKEHSPQLLEVVVNNACDYFKQSDYLLNLDGQDLHNFIEDFHKHMNKL